MLKAPEAYNPFMMRTGAPDESRRSLAGGGIASGIYDPVPLHVQRRFDDPSYGPGGFPVTEAVEEVLSLLIDPEFTAELLDAVIDRRRDAHGAS